MHEQSTAERSFTNIFGLLDLLDPQAPEEFKKRYLAIQEAKQKISDTLREKKQDLKLDELKIKVLDKLNKLDDKLSDVFFKRPGKFEKFFYPFTLLNIFTIGFLMGHKPEIFHIYYTILFFLLIPIRAYTYYKTNNHYFLADLCYYVNGMCLLFIWAFPNNISLYLSTFALTFGTLSWAVITWKNSLVTHSVDKVTSCFIHIMPPLTIHVITHVLDDTDFQRERFPAVYLSKANITNNGGWPLKTNIFYTSLYYLLWQCSYHYFITIRQSTKIQSGERMTSFEYLTKHTFKNTPILSTLLDLPDPYPMLLYILFQYLYQLITMSLCGIWFADSHAASIFLLSIFLVASYNGATYYIDYYGDQGLRKEIKKLQLEIRNIQGSDIEEDEAVR
ncbi:uncharacterized protein SCODWIG_01707 [Saccharomycodes ludwigii]|uniref:Glycerophosphocholine acyltransferase 1 n=2 Tax=Saccharomycodes ludwigii TaxID=36035 RepID=A0A376B5H4_9ASCO|nr:uncharacterized protein SCODWIG_01707 [Saccharomycodes ludwigii]